MKTHNVNIFQSEIDFGPGPLYRIRKELPFCAYHFSFFYLCFSWRILPNKFVIQSPPSNVLHCVPFILSTPSPAWCVCTPVQQGAVVSHMEHFEWLSLMSVFGLQAKRNVQGLAKKRLLVQLKTNSFIYL